MRGRRYLVINPSRTIIAPQFSTNFFIIRHPCGVKSGVKCVFFRGSFPHIEWWLWAEGGNRLWSYLGPAPRGLNPHSMGEGEKRKFWQNKICPGVSPHLKFTVEAEQAIHKDKWQTEQVIEKVLFQSCTAHNIRLACFMWKWTTCLCNDHKYPISVQK